MSDIAIETALEQLLRRVIREEVQNIRSESKDPDNLITAEEAARLLAVSPDWLYRHAKQLPFTRKIHHKMIRFSYLGLQKYMTNAKKT